MPRIPLPPYPNGWFAVAHSDSLARGQVRGVHYLGEDLVIFRGEDGQVRVADAYCPHLGAHLGKGGKVEGNTLRCPFHGWRFDGRDGRCVEIPYAKRIPPQARLDSYPALECNGMILVWHHAEGKEPEWQPEVVPEILDPSYELHRTHEWTIKSHPQEIMENGVDFAHFATLHGWKCKAIHWEPDGPYYRLKIDVDTDHGVVTLTGPVHSTAERAEALRLAKNTMGVKRVVNKLELETAATTGKSDKDEKSTAAKAKDKTEEAAKKTADATKSGAKKTASVLTDAEITTAVKTKLLADPKVGGLAINVDTSKHVVTLTGAVHSPEEKAEALRLARTTMGVHNVVSKLTIEPKK